MGEEELSAAATASLLELLKAAPPPPARKWAWEADLPAIVTESAEQAERDYHDSMAKMEAVAAAEAEEDHTTTANEDKSEKLFTLESMPDDSYALAVCKIAFVPPRGTSDALLHLEIGNLVRITSLLDAKMCQGFPEGKRDKVGWFPRANVHVIEDPLS